MRRTLLATILTLGLLLAPLAAADDSHANATGQAKANGHAENETADNDTGNETGHGHGLSAAMESFHNAFAALLASWHENATKVREACHAEAQAGNNTTKADHLAWAHCIRDGYHKLFEQRHAAREAALDAKGAGKSGESHGQAGTRGHSSH